MKEFEKPVLEIVILANENVMENPPDETSMV